MMIGAATLFGTYGGTFIYDGADYTNWNNTVYDYLDIEIYGAGEDNHISHMALGDVDGDGNVDLMVAGTDRSRGNNGGWGGGGNNSQIASGIYSDFTSLGGEYSIDDANMEFKDSSSPYGAVKSVIDMDMNGDGYPEVLLSDYADTSWGQLTGESFLYVFQVPLFKMAIPMT